MRTFIRDVLVGMFAAALMFALMGWYNAPAYEACARSHSQSFCYTVLK